MKRLMLAVVVLMLVATPAVAVLCEKCAKRGYTTDLGKCVACGGPTTSGAFKLCPACSRKLGQCEHCRAPLGGAKTPAKVTPVDTKKSGVYTSGKWRYEYTIGAVGSRSEGRHGELAFDGKPIAGMEKLDRINTPWGMMQFFGPRPRRWGNGGWLLKTTYDGAINPKTGRLLPDPDARAKLTAERAKALKADLKNFQLHLRHFGERGKPFYVLVLSTRAIPVRHTTPFHLSAVIDEKQVLRIVDHLATSGFLGSAESDLHQSKPITEIPCYALYAFGGPEGSCHGNLGWGLPMLKRLDALRGVLDGDAAKQMDLLLGRLSGLRKAWEKADSTPRK